MLFHFLPHFPNVINSPMKEFAPRNQCIPLTVEDPSLEGCKITFEEMAGKLM